MIRCQVIEKFRLKDFDQLKNLQRVSQEQPGSLGVGDTFECDEQMAKYLTGENLLKRSVVKIIEVQPEEKTEEQPKPKKKYNKNK